LSSAQRRCTKEQPVAEPGGALCPDARTFFDQSKCQEELDVAAAIMTKLSLKPGLKQWGGKAAEAVRSEMTQLHFRDALKPFHWNESSHAQKLNVLESHLFLKEKRDSEVKERTVAGGNKQRDCVSKEEASSPAVATGSALLTCVVDAEEGRDNAT
jgi:hypothetical protein